MAMVTDAEIAEQAEVVDGLRREIKEVTREPKQKLKLAEEALRKLLAEKRSGQMTFDPNTGEIPDPDKVPLSHYKKR